MNGDIQIIYDAIKENGTHISKIYTRIEGMEVRQALQHKENREAIKKIVFHNENCSRDHSTTKAHVKVHWFLISIILIGLLGTVWANLK